MNNLDNLESSKIELHFFKADNGNLIDWLINLYTNRNEGKNDIGFSHVELSIENDLERELFDKGTKICFSSKTSTNGTSWDLIDLKDDYVSIDITNLLKKLNIHPNTLLFKIKGIENKRYDYFGIFFNEFLEDGLQCDQRWYCSEVMYYLLELGKPNDPNALYNLITKLINEK